MSVPVTSSALLSTYPRAEVTFVRGSGCRLWDDAGREYLDFAGGIAVVALGHCHPVAVAAAHAQIDRLWHVSNLYWTEPMAALAERLSARFGGAQAFFCNSGAEANEAALKYARKATGRPGIVALEGSFHGRTFGSLSITGQPAKRAAFEPLVPGVTFVEPNDIAALEAAVGDDTAAVVMEPILGEGGVVPLTPEYLAAAKAAADAHGALLILDEVQTGVGRTGSFFAFEQLGIRPHAATLAKALANGLPIGALVVADEVAGAFVPGDHASTFGGNPVTTAVACAVVDAVDDELLARVHAAGERLEAALAALPAVTEVRGRGLLLAAEVGRDPAPLVAACLERGLVIISAGPTSLRLAPPLVVSDEELDEAVAVLAEVLA
jgi:acetylornithine/N-succinyldiaminopimelate aminotransferase